MDQQTPVVHPTVEDKLDAIIDILGALCLKLTDCTPVYRIPRGVADPEGWVDLDTQWAPRGTGRGFAGWAPLGTLTEFVKKTMNETSDPTSP